MAEHRRGINMSPELLKVAERARHDTKRRFNSLAHLLDQEALKRAYGRIRKNAAVGVDGIDKETYGQRLQDNLRDLHERLRSGQYRHQPILRKLIPKEQGKERPIGISTIEDKIVQGALTEVLGAIYEQDFRDCSYGFRRGRSVHDALRALNHMLCYERIQWIVEADIQSYFDSVERSKLVEMLRGRIADGRLMRLIGKCLHVGVLDGESYSEPTEGTTQGSIISPLLGNVYLHHVLDVWFEDEVRPTLRGAGRLIRYADDFVMGFASKADAERVLALLRERMESFGLTLHPDKTRIIYFGRPWPKQEMKRGKRSTFDFLGFTIYWRRSRKGFWVPGMKTRKARLRKAIQAIYDCCRSHRHRSVAEQHATLSRRLQGHYNFFAINGNARSVGLVYQEASRAWFKWLRRRSQRTRLTWERFARYLQVFPLPRPHITKQIWGAAS